MNDASFILFKVFAGVYIDALVAGHKRRLQNEGAHITFALERNIIHKQEKPPQYTSNRKQLGDRLKVTSKA